MDSSIENDENGLVLIDLNQYTRLEGIGYGGFARIYMIEEISTKKIFAAKVFDRNGTTSFEEMKMFYKEIEIMSKLKSPFIIKFIGYSLHDFEHKPNHVIIMEYAGNSSLLDILEKARKGLAPNEWTETKKLIFIYSLALGLAHIHSQNIVHRDIKPGNILLDDYLLPKISDFGLSAIGQEDLDIQYIGTLIYAGPRNYSRRKAFKTS